MNIKDIERGDDFQHKRKYPSFRKNFYVHFSEYTENTSIHGMKYLGEKKRSILERFSRLCWLLVLSTSLSVCVFYIAETYERWQTAPTAAKLSRTIRRSITEIPFPAVTICPENKVRPTVFNYTEIFGRFWFDGNEWIASNLTAEESQQLEYIALVCDQTISIYENTTMGYEGLNFLSKVAPQLTDVLDFCDWMNMKCGKKSWTPLFTEEGWCFNFNLLDREELFSDVVVHYNRTLQHGTKSHWSLEKGYPKEAPIDTFPKRQIASGKRSSLTIYLKLHEQDFDYICKDLARGFKVSLHSPVEMPKMMEQSFRVPANQLVMVAIKPDMTTTSDRLIDYEIQIRQCYLSKEKHLKYFKIYTKNNCELECLTNFTLQRCGCVSYYMPRDKMMKICGGRKGSDCVYESQELLESSVIDSSHNNSASYYQKFCNCLPSCASLTYSADVSQADFDMVKHEAYQNLGFTWAKITFFFKQHQFLASETYGFYELYSMTDFIGACGGLLGVFTGFSFISMVEILYFVTLRLYCDIRHYGHHLRSRSPDSEIMTRDMSEMEQKKIDRISTVTEQRRLPTAVPSNTFDLHRL